MTDSKVGPSGNPESELHFLSQFSVCPKDFEQLLKGLECRKSYSINSHVLHLQSGLQSDSPFKFDVWIKSSTLASNAKFVIVSNMCNAMKHARDKGRISIAPLQESPRLSTGAFPLQVCPLDCACFSVSYPFNVLPPRFEGRG
jgi:hypothetical protein